jgi:putative membrane protein
MTPNAQAILASWSAPIGVNVSLCLAALVYTNGWLHLRKKFPDLISAGRIAAFFAGIISLWIAVGSPLDAFDDVSLPVHMVQHLLLMAMAPPFILLGAPALPLLQGIPQSMARGVVGPCLRWGLVKRLARFVFNPAVGWLAAALALIGWHIPAAFELALRSHSWHELEHISFFGTGLLFWWPVVQPWPSTARWPRWSIPLYLFSATLPCDALSGFLAFCDRVVYPSYLSAPQILTISPLQAQECAAALIWTCVTIIFLVPAVVITIQILSPELANLPAQPWPALNTIAGQPIDASNSEVT